MKTPPIRWTLLSSAHTRSGSLLISVEHFADDDTIANFETERATSTASVDHDIDWHCNPEDHIHVLTGPEIHPMDREELAEDLIRWICDAGTKFCADRGAL